jgi:lipoprotein-anchoring transpeptidase ErfK/SrfK
MVTFIRFGRAVLLVSSVALLTACASMGGGRFSSNYESRLPQEMNTGGKKMVLVDPNVHAWGAYDSDGHLIRAGIATAGGTVCPPDEPGGNCRTSAGTHRITSLGDGNCASKKYPRPHGGGLMPYCMFFSGGQALHGSPDPIVIEDNVSHGCVRMRIQDAEWMRENFAQVGTKVVVVPYN